MILHFCFFNVSFWTPSLFDSLEYEQSVSPVAYKLISSVTSPQEGRGSHLMVLRGGVCVSRERLHGFLSATPASLLQSNHRQVRQTRNCDCKLVVYLFLWPGDTQYGCLHPVAAEIGSSEPPAPQCRRSRYRTWRDG